MGLRKNSSDGGPLGAATPLCVARQQAGTRTSLLCREHPRLAAGSAPAWHILGAGQSAGQSAEHHIPQQLHRAAKLLTAPLPATEDQGLRH